MFVRRAVILSRGHRALVRPTNRLVPARRLATPTASLLSHRQFSVSHRAMADAANTSGVTADGLKEKLTVELEAQFVEIDDMSGTVSSSLRNIKIGI